MFGREVGDHDFGTEMEDTVFSNKFPLRIHPLPVVGERSFHIAIEAVTSAVMGTEALGMVEHELTCLTGASSTIIVTVIFSPITER
mgnify:CR=1 FL=1|jgi:hypothetical protein